LTYDGYQYELAPYQTSGNDNLISQGQQIPVTQGKYFSAQMLVAAESSTATGSVTAYYADGSTSTGGIQASPWWLWAYPSGGDIVMPFYYTDNSTNYNKTNIFQAVNWLDSTKELVSLTLPVSDDSNRLHIFAISLRPVVPSIERISGPQLEVRYARSTKKWIEGTNNIQIFEVIVSNVGQHNWVSANDVVVVSIESEGVLCVNPGIIKRLRPGDQVFVEVGVINKQGVVPGTRGNASVRLHSSTVDIEHNFEASFGIGSYEPTYESIYSHESPSWYSNAKFGVFIHYGLYSIPAWVSNSEFLTCLPYNVSILLMYLFQGNSGSNETYAEW
jgi:alpha-L-fucosidase